MNHADHVNLIRGGVVPGVWADCGSGGGAFTLALADLLGGGEIYSIDRDRRALDEQRAAMRARFPDSAVHYLTADFTQSLDLPPLDGIVMANSLHFVRHKEPVLKRIYSYLKPGGRLVMVEYNVDSGNMWVPHPFSFETWQTLAGQNGFANTRKIGARPSRNLREIYSALSIKAE
ncbi:MAG: class I SAM-dependent methyltransferase [Anaerolineae bacterium]|nr:class I SAM-dependent methyltransferase [Anaerolineae bacterium]